MVSSIKIQASRWALYALVHLVWPTFHSLKSGNYGELWGLARPGKRFNFLRRYIFLVHPVCSIFLFKVKLANGDGKVVYSMKSNCVVVLHNICTEFSIFRIQYLSVLCLCIMRITEVWNPNLSSNREICGSHMKLILRNTSFLKLSHLYFVSFQSSSTHSPSPHSTSVL